MLRGSLPNIKDGEVSKGQIMEGILFSTKVLRVPEGGHQRVSKQESNLAILCVALYCWLGSNMEDVMENCRTSGRKI